MGRQEYLGSVIRQRKKPREDRKIMISRKRSTGRIQKRLHTDILISLTLESENRGIHKKKAQVGRLNGFLLFKYSISQRFHFFLYLQTRHVTHSKNSRQWKASNEFSTKYKSEQLKRGIFLKDCHLQMLEGFFRSRRKEGKLKGCQKMSKTES